MADRVRYGPWALILGGSEGVGAAFAEKLARSGINIMLVARKPEPLAQVADLVRRLGVEVRTASLDLATVDAPDRVREAADGLEIGLMIHNAGTDNRFGYFHDRPYEDAARLIALNITTPTALVHHFGGKMRERRRGGIILIGSNAAYAGGPRMAIYSAAKAYSSILAEGLWYEMKEHGVDLLGLSLSTTRTPAMDRLGVPLDLPGYEAADPGDVAQEGLDQLGNGPVWFAAGTVEQARNLRTKADRAEAVTHMAHGAELLGLGS